MLVALLNTKSTGRGLYLLNAFAAGVKARGDAVVPVYGADNLDRLAAADVAVQVCYPNRHHDGSDLSVFRLKANDLMHAAGKRVITIDTGFVRNQTEAELAAKTTFRVDDPATYEAHDHTVYYAVGYDGLKNTADYCNQGVPGDRWQALGRPLAPWRRAGAHVVVVGQPPNGQSTQHLSVTAWYAEAAKALAKQSRHRTVVFRPHPRVMTLRTNRGRQLADERAVRGAMGAKVLYSKAKTFAHDLRGAWAVLVLTSNAAVEAAVAGVPVFACDRGCMAWDVAAHGLRGLEAPATPDRTAWAHRLAYAQWNAAELKSGACWSRLAPHAVRVPA